MQSEFNDAYDDWLTGARERARTGLFDLPITALDDLITIAVEPSCSVRDAIETMIDLHVGCVMIEEDGEMRGIFTERDVLRRVVTHGIDIDTTPVHEVMTRKPSTTTADATLANVLRTMCERDHRHLPILDENGRCRGVVSMRRIAQYLVDACPNEILNAPPTGQGPPATVEGG